MYDIDVWKFWDMTIGEITDVIQARERKIHEERQFSALLAYNKMRASCLSDKFPEIYEVFPTLFDRDEIMKAKAESDREKLKATLRAWGELGRKNTEKE